MLCSHQDSIGLYLSFFTHLNTLSNSLSFKLCQGKFRTLTIYLFTAKWNFYFLGNTVLNITYTEIWDFTVQIFAIQDSAPEFSPKEKYFRYYYKLKNLGDMSHRNIGKKTDNNKIQIFNMKHRIQIIYLKKINLTFLENTSYYFMCLVNVSSYLFIYLVTHVFLGLLMLF